MIGITADFEEEKNFILNESYVNAVIRAGGIPFILPCSHEVDYIQFVKRLDGLLLTGGGDMNPMLFGEEPHQNLGYVNPVRDAFEYTLAQKMLKENKPILGICRGLQILNIVLKGNMYQDIYAQNHSKLLQHNQNAPRSHRSHVVQVKKETLLYEIAQVHEFKVNSYHHQAVKDVLKPLIISATAKDGIIEAIESTNHRFVLGVQWHPEVLAESGDRVSLNLFAQFIKQSRMRRLEIEGY